MLSDLTKRQIRVARHKAKCENCGAQTEYYSDVADEGFGYSAILYENKFGREVFFHSIEDQSYLGSPAKRIIELNESFERAGEKIKIRRRQPVCVFCPDCGAKHLESYGEPDEIFIDAYEIFATRQKNRN